MPSRYALTGDFPFQGGGKCLGSFGLGREQTTVWVEESTGLRGKGRKRSPAGSGSFETLILTVTSRCPATTRNTTVIEFRPRRGKGHGVSGCSSRFLAKFSLILERGQVARTRGQFVSIPWLVAKHLPVTLHIGHRGCSLKELSLVIFVSFLYKCNRWPAQRASVMATMRDGLRHWWYILLADSN